MLVFSRTGSYKIKIFFFVFQHDLIFILKGDKWTTHSPVAVVDVQAQWGGAPGSAVPLGGGYPQVTG